MGEDAGDLAALVVLVLAEDGERNGREGIRARLAERGVRLAARLGRGVTHVVYERRTDGLGNLPGPRPLVVSPLWVEHLGSREGAAWDVAHELPQPAVDLLSPLSASCSGSARKRRRRPSLLPRTPSGGTPRALELGPAGATSGGDLGVGDSTVGRGGLGSSPSGDSLGAGLWGSGSFDVSSPAAGSQAPSRGPWRERAASFDSSSTPTSATLPASPPADDSPSPRPAAAWVGASPAWPTDGDPEDALLDTPLSVRLRRNLSLRGGTPPAGRRATSRLAVDEPEPAPMDLGSRLEPGGSRADRGLWLGRELGPLPSPRPDSSAARRAPSSSAPPPALDLGASGFTFTPHVRAPSRPDKAGGMDAWAGVGSPATPAAAGPLWASAAAPPVPSTLDLAGEAAASPRAAVTAAAPPPLAPSPEASTPTSGPAAVEAAASLLLSEPRPRPAGGRASTLPSPRRRAELAGKDRAHARATGRLTPAAPPIGARTRRREGSLEPAP